MTANQIQTELEARPLTSREIGEIAGDAPEEFGAPPFVWWRMRRARRPNQADRRIAIDIYARAMREGYSGRVLHREARAQMEKPHSGIDPLTVITLMRFGWVIVSWIRAYIRRRREQ